MAAEEGHIGTAEALLKAGAGVDAANLISYTPLHRAACMTRPAMVKLLLQKVGPGNRTPSLLSAFAVIVTQAAMV